MLEHADYPPSMFKIMDVNDSRLNDYRSLKENANGLRERGMLVVEGPEPVARLLESSIPIHSVFFDEGYHERFQNAVTERGIPSEKVFVADRRIMSAVVGYRLHRGVMAVASRPEPVSPGRLRFPIVALNAVADPENVGSIIRSANAFGVRSFVVDPQTSDPLLRRSVRVSVGSVLSSDLCYVPSISDLVETVGPDVSVVAVEQTDDAVPLSQFLFSERSIFIFGKERGGIDPQVLRRCTGSVQVPIDRTSVNSLNVGCAAAVVLSRFFESQHSPERKDHMELIRLDIAAAGQ